MKKSFALSCLAAALSGSAWAGDTTQLDEITVTGTREAQRKAETPATVDVIQGEDLRAARPAHPTQIMGRVPGVWVNVTGGEGHQTAIRQPLTTNPVYQYLEDGIPTRSTGFFNHNALYEINLPQAGGIEVNKGPGTALYGSDAIGGVVNVLTRPAPLAPEAEASGELGGYGWKRLLLSGGNTVGDNGYRVDLNLTTTKGWRQTTGYDRQSATARLDRALGNDAVLKLVATYSNIDQQTAGSSTIVESDYLDNPTLNYTPVSFRKVKAFRLSAAYENQLSGDALLSLTPYYRNNSMDLLANWSLSYDPTVYNTRNQSFGVQAKYRRDFAPMRARLIVGVDVDHSPGSRKEDSIVTTNVGAGATRQYIAYTVGTRIYDYDVAYQGVSPYLHGELSPLPQLRVTAGLRYDDISYDYRNNLASGASVVGNKNYGHAPDTTTHYTHASPKLGLTYAFSDNFNVFAAYNHAFRAPSEGQLFRPPSSSNAVLAQTVALAATQLKPIKVDSYEMGVRGKGDTGLGYEVSLYRMEKRDDVVSYRDPATTATTSTNAGKTLHQGIEIGVNAEPVKTLRLDLAYSYAKHTYEDWNVVTGTINSNLSGKEMETAPRTIANLRLTYAPGFMNGGSLGAEVVTLGNYWMDQNNTQKYSGHDLLNLSASYPVGGLELFARVNNVADKRFAESASYSTNNGRVFAPGLPRTVYAGLQYRWK
ncbi:MAG: TonB-dependent receptor [Pseudomonadota bacterium]